MYIELDGDSHLACCDALDGETAATALAFWARARTSSPSTASQDLTGFGADGGRTQPLPTGPAASSAAARS
jgi:hypothetical protein